MRLPHGRRTLSYCVGLPHVTIALTRGLMTTEPREKTENKNARKAKTRVLRTFISFHLFSGEEYQEFSPEKPGERHRNRRHDKKVLKSYIVVLHNTRSAE